MLSVLSANRCQENVPDPIFSEIIPGFIAAWAAIYFVSLATESQGEYRAVPAA